MGTKKNFVLDTNVILHDYNCLKNFQENDIYLPIVVLEELDKDGYIELVDTNNMGYLIYKK